MIKSFANKATEKIWCQQWIKGVPRDIQKIAFRKLIMINRALTLHDLLVPPGNRLEKLTGDRDGEMSIRVNNQYRICFSWLNNDAYDVELVDYH